MTLGLLLLSLKTISSFLSILNFSPLCLSMDGSCPAWTARRRDRDAIFDELLALAAECLNDMCFFFLFLFFFTTSDLMAESYWPC